MTYHAPSLLLSDFSSCPFAAPIRVHSRFFSTWQRGDGDSERRSSESPRRCLRSFSQELARHKFGFPDANAPLFPRLHHSDFSEGSQRRKNRHAKGKRQIVKGDL